MRRLPIYILIDTSGSMKGKPIESVKAGLDILLSSLCKDPYLLEVVHISIITFDTEAKCILPLAPIDDLQLPEITATESEPTNVGAALQTLCELMDKELRPSTENLRGDWRPLLFIMTDGKFSDLQLYNNMATEVKNRNFSRIVACPIDTNTNLESLKLLTDRVCALDTLDNYSFNKYFATDLFVCINKDSTYDLSQLPPPPDIITIII